MIVGSSAVIAILRKEPGWERLEARLAGAGNAGIGAPTLVESSMVLCGRIGPAGRSLVAQFIAGADIDVIDFTAEHWTVAAGALLRYGKGRHPPALNFGDCLTYAVCRLAGEPVLCLGDDFARTDLELVG